MPDAVEAAWQDMKQEAADEFVRCERHDTLPLRTITAIVLVAEGDASLVESEQPAVRDGYAMEASTASGPAKGGLA